VSAYYNENDPKTAAWLRELIRQGLIADGEVDTRSIVDVRPDDLRGFVQCHFFAGIGGWSYALRLAGWPDEREVWTGSCPCQPWSVAGKGQGADDPRDLWPAWYGLIRKCRPQRVFGEQVDSADGRLWLDIVSNNLEHVGYAIGSVGLPACSVGAPHNRPRLWFVANAHSAGLPERSDDCGDHRSAQPPLAWGEFERVHATNTWARWDAESEVRVFAHGVPNVGGRLRGYGNSISPYVGAEVIAAYMEIA
jgi:DNA (cytosine-5)-methyltransferase 1